MPVLLILTLIFNSVGLSFTKNTIFYIFVQKVYRSLQLISITCKDDHTISIKMKQAAYNYKGVPQRND